MLASHQPCLTARQAPMRTHYSVVITNISRCCTTSRTITVGVAPGAGGTGGKGAGWNKNPRTKQHAIKMCMCVYARRCAGTIAATLWRNVLHPLGRFFVGVCVRLVPLGNHASTTSMSMSVALCTQICCCRCFSVQWINCPNHIRKRGSKCKER